MYVSLKANKKCLFFFLDLTTNLFFMCILRFMFISIVAIKTVYDDYVYLN